MTTELDDKIQDAAEGPAFASDDGGSMKQQSLRELIETEKFLAANRVVKKGQIGLRFASIKPPGAV